jgi:hypothetical protein
MRLVLCHAHTDSRASVNLCQQLSSAHSAIPKTQSLFSLTRRTTSVPSTAGHVCRTTKLLTI